RLRPDLIVALDPPAALAAKKATPSIPIIAAILNDPVRLGLIASYARPGGNLTGILSQVEGLPGKQVEIAQELVPAITLIGVLANPANATQPVSAARNRGRCCGQGGQGDRRRKPIEGRSRTRFQLLARRRG